MKKMRLVAALLGLTLLISLLSACGNRTPKSLSGRYVGQGSTAFRYIEFFSDGKYTSSHSNYEGDYSIDGNRIRLEGVLVDSRIYYFRVNGNTLELSRNEEFKSPDVYKK